MVDQKKEDFMTQVEHYRAVLDDLQNQRNVLQYRIKEIDTAITSLHRLIPEGAKNEVPTPAMPNVPSAVVPQGKYARHECAMGDSESTGRRRHRAHDHW